MISPGVELYEFSTRFGWVVALQLQPSSKQLRLVRRFIRSTTKPAPGESMRKASMRRLFSLCSRQESNLEHWYRKPVFYPLNYESKRGS